MTQDTGGYLKKAVYSWEMLRLAYNAVLLTQGLCFTWGGVRGFFSTTLAYVLAIVVFGLSANAFYCLGPLVETYAFAIYGKRLGNYRYALFGLGLLFSMGVIACSTVLLHLSMDKIMGAE